MNFEDYSLSDRAVYYVDCVGWGVIRRQQRAEMRREMAVLYLEQFIRGASEDLEKAVQEVARANRAVDQVRSEAQMYLRAADRLGETPQLQQERLKTFQSALAYALRDINRAQAASDACRSALDTAYLLQQRLGASVGTSTVKKFQATLRRVGAVISDQTLTTLEEGTHTDDALDTVDRIDGAALEHDMNELLQGLRGVASTPDNASERAAEIISAMVAQIRTPRVLPPAVGREDQIEPTTKTTSNPTATSASESSRKLVPA